MCHADLECWLLCRLLQQKLARTELFKVGKNGLPRWSSRKKKKNCLRTQEMQVRTLGQEDPLKEEMATHSSILAWEIPWTGDPGRLQSMGLQRVGHNWASTQGRIGGDGIWEQEVCRLSEGRNIFKLLLINLHSSCFKSGFMLKDQSRVLRIIKMITLWFPTQYGGL